MSNVSPTDRVLLAMEHLQYEGTGFAMGLFRRCKLQSVQEGLVVFRCTTLPEDSNTLGALQGGAIATLIDYCSSAALYSTKKFWVWGGVSSDMSITYVNAAPIGEDIDITCDVKRIGGRTTQILTTITLSQTGKTVAFSSHTKINMDEKMKGTPSIITSSKL